MSEFAALREALDALASRAASPDYDELKRRATRRHRRRVVVLATAAAGFITLGGGVTASSLGGSDRLTPDDGPAAPSSPSPTGPAGPAQPASARAFGESLDAILEQAPGWTTKTGPYSTGYDYAANGPCSGKWREGSTGGGDGTAPHSDNSDGLAAAGFATQAQASAAASLLVEGLATCTATAWRTQPIAQTSAVLASSAEAVVWIQQTADTVNVLQVRTTDGPPPVAVQVDVAAWMASFHNWQEQNH